MLLLSPIFFCKHEAPFLLSATGIHREDTMGLSVEIWAGEAKPGLGALQYTTTGVRAGHRLSTLHSLYTKWCSKAGETLAQGKGVSTREPGPMPVLRSWPLYSIYFALLHILTHLLITWSCGNRSVIQAIFVLIASGFHRLLAYVQKEDIRAFMGVKFYNESLLYKTDHLLMGGMRK